MIIWYEEVAKKDWFRSDRIDHRFLCMEFSVDQIWLISIERPITCSK